MRAPEPSLALATCATLIALGSVACAPRGPERVPEALGEVLDGVERALERGDFASAHHFVDFRYRLEESLGDLWRGGPESAREELVRRLEEMFDETSEAQRQRLAGQRLVRRVLARQGRHVWVESSVARAGERGQGFAWRYRLTPRGTTWAITQREYLVDGMPSDSTRFWPMARQRIAESFGRQATLSELAANLPKVMGTMHIRRIRIPDLTAPLKPPPP